MPNVFVPFAPRSQRPAGSCNVAMVEERNDVGTAEATEDRKEERTPLPKLQLAIVFLIQFAEPVTALVVYPFVNKLVRETGITGGDEAKTGYYAGIIESAFFFSETITVIGWGWLSDMFGRKPILLMGPLGLSLSMLGFGLSKSYWPLVYFRTFQGFFNGNIGVSKSIIAEITDSTNIGDAYALSPLMWGAGLTLAPTIGGILSDPATQWPDTFGKFTFFHEYPYFLPCAVAALIAFVSFLISSIALKETLPTSRKIKFGNVWDRLVQKLKPSTDESKAALLANAEPIDGYGAVNTESANPIAVEEERPPFSQLFVRPFVVTLLNYGLLAFTDMSTFSLVPLVYSTPIEFGGLGLDPFKIGVFMGIYGLVNGLISSLFLGSFLRKYGPTKVYKFCIMTFFITFGAFPVANTLARRAGGVDIYVALVIFIQFAGMTLVSPCYAAVLIMIVNTTPSKYLLGSANGVAQMVSSANRAMAPAIASSLFSISIQHNLANGYAVFYFFFVLTVGLQYSSRYLPPSDVRAQPTK